MTLPQPSEAVATVSNDVSVEDIEKIMASLEAESSSVAAPIAQAAQAVPTQAAQTNVAQFVKSVSPIQVFITAESLKRDVHIDIENLDTVCVEHASLFVHYANIKAKARAQFEKMKAAFDILESRMYAEKRVLLMADATKKTTEAQVDAAVKSDPRWWGGKNRVIEAQGVYDLSANAASAFEQRRDMIIQIGSDRRNERKGEIRIVQQNRDAAVAASVRG